MGIIYTDLRLSNFSDENIMEIDAKALVDSGACELIIPEHIADRLKLKELKPREVILANGQRETVKFVGPIKVEMMGRECGTFALVMGDQVILGAIPMQSLDVFVHPKSERVIPNPESPNIPTCFVKSAVATF